MRGRPLTTETARELARKANGVPKARRQCPHLTRDGQPCRNSAVYRSGRGWACCVHAEPWEEGRDGRDDPQ